jgi:hypothetical protein
MKKMLLITTLVGAFMGVANTAYAVSVFEDMTACGYLHGRSVLDPAYKSCMQEKDASRPARVSAEIERLQNQAIKAEAEKQAKYRAEHPEPKFDTLANFSLACENTRFRNNDPNDRSHVWFEIMPSQWTVKMTNDKGETFTFPIKQGMRITSNARNEFGHEVVVPSAAWVYFQDNGGKWRNIHHYEWIGYNHRYMYVPGGPNNQGPADSGWGYTCFVT